MWQTDLPPRHRGDLVGERKVFTTDWNKAPSGENYNSTLALYVKINSKCIQHYIQSLNYNHFSRLKKKGQMRPEKYLCGKSA